MNYSIEIIRKTEQNTTAWSGGTTTQLAIFPKDALYSERNFLWRISSAKTEMEESVFTSLPGIWRWIMVLEGELRLEHEGHHKVTLVPFKQDNFSGDWITKSYGKVTDFNLMMAHGYEGNLEAITLPKGASWMAPPIDTKLLPCFTQALYCVKGKMDILVDEKIETLEGEDFFLFQGARTDSVQQLTINNPNETEACVISVRVFNGGK